MKKFKIYLDTSVISHLDAPDTPEKMNDSKTNTYTVDEIHKMRLDVAELYRGMKPDEAERDFKAHVENAKKTMQVLRNKRRVSMS